MLRIVEGLFVFLDLFFNSVFVIGDFWTQAIMVDLVLS